MDSMKKRGRSHCPIAFALELIGDQWSLLILRDLLFKGKRLYGEFLNSEEGIATNILAERLARLEKTGIITKTNDPSNKKQFIYAPTRKGLELVPLLLEMIRWSAKHDPKTAAPKEFIRRLEKDSAALLAEVVGQFKK